MVSMTTSWEEATLLNFSSIVLTTSSPGGKESKLSADSAIVKGEQAQSDVSPNVTVTMAAVDAAIATSGGGDRHALLYIVVVLAFYAIGIVAALIMYLRRERADMDEEKVYDDYAAIHRDPWKWARYYRMQQVMTKLQNARVENPSNPRRTEVGEIHHLGDGSVMDDDTDELTIDIPRLLGEGGSTKRMALPDGETVVVTFRMPNPENVRGSRPSSLLRSRYETINEERESMTDSDKSSHIGENGTTADNELSDDSIKERQRMRSGSGRFSRRKRSCEQPLLTSRYDKIETKNEFNILDDDEGKDADDASSEAGFEPQDKGAILRSWGIKPRLSRWNDYMDLSEMTSSPTDDHSDSNLLSSVGSPCRDNPGYSSKAKNSAMLPGNAITTIATIDTNPPPVTIQCQLDNYNDPNRNTLQNNNIHTYETTCDSDPTSLESSTKRHQYEYLHNDAEGKLLRLPTGDPSNFKSSKPTDIDAAYKETKKIFEFIEANYSRSLPFLSAKGKPTDIDSVSNQLLSLSTEEIESGFIQGLRCSSSPSIPNCKASEVFQFARPDSSDALTEYTIEQTEYDKGELNQPCPRVGDKTHSVSKKSHGGISGGTESNAERLDLPGSKSPSGLILQPQEYIKNLNNGSSSVLSFPISHMSATKQNPPAVQKSGHKTTKVDSFSKPWSIVVSNNNNEENSSSRGSSRLGNMEKLDDKRHSDILRANSLNSTRSSSQDSATELKSLDLGYPHVIGCEQNKTNMYSDRQVHSSQSKSKSDVPSGVVRKPLQRDNSKDNLTKCVISTDVKGKQKSLDSNDSLKGFSDESKASDDRETLKGSICLSRSKSGSDTTFDAAANISLDSEGRSKDSSESLDLKSKQGSDEKGSNSFLDTLNEENQGGNSTGTSSCDEISLLADDHHLYDSNERINSDIDDADIDDDDDFDNMDDVFNDEEMEEFSDDFASETFTELEKLADEGSMEHLVDDGFCSPDFSDLPMDQSDQYQSFTPEGHGTLEKKSKGEEKNKINTEKSSFFKDAKLSNVEDKVVDNKKSAIPRSVLDILNLSKQVPSNKSSPSKTPSKPYVQSSRRETTFLPDSHKCVSESTLGTGDTLLPTKKGKERQSLTPSNLGRRLNIPFPGGIKTPAQNKTPIPRSVSALPSTNTKGIPSNKNTSNSSLSSVGSRKVSTNPMSINKQENKSVLGRSSTTNLNQKPTPKSEIERKITSVKTRSNVKPLAPKTRQAGTIATPLKVGGTGANKPSQNTGAKLQTIPKLTSQSQPPQMDLKSKQGKQPQTSIPQKQSGSRINNQKQTTSALHKLTTAGLPRQGQSSLAKSQQSNVGRQIPNAGDRNQQGLNKLTQQSIPGKQQQVVGKQPPQQQQQQQQQQSTSRQNTPEPFKQPTGTRSQQPLGISRPNSRPDETIKANTNKPVSNIPVSQGIKTGGLTPQQRTAAQHSNKAGNGPHNVHGITSTKIQTPNISQKVASRVTTI